MDLTTNDQQTNEANYQFKNLASCFYHIVLLTVNDGNEKMYKKLKLSLHNNH